MLEFNTYTYKTRVTYGIHYVLLRELCFRIIAYDLVLTNWEIGAQTYSKHFKGECFESISTCLAQNT